jgi:hypothetical protein
MFYYHCFSTLIEHTPLYRTKKTDSLELNGILQILVNANDVNYSAKQRHQKKKKRALLNASKLVGQKAKQRKLSTCMFMSCHQTAGQNCDCDKVLILGNNNTNQHLIHSRGRLNTQMLATMQFRIFYLLPICCLKM